MPDLQAMALTITTVVGGEAKIYHHDINTNFNTTQLTTIMSLKRNTTL
jgi:hypothetical protein